ncbi:MAG: hypothetical protein JWO37_3379 [Acidimicrobiales bacterium]|nr:hypothetical protein [Acidimicrobiales bacterium]
MNLSERLSAAKLRREGFEDVPGPDVDVESAEPVHSPGWGKPGPCPRCTTMGEVDFIDLVRAITSQHCPSCGFEWVLSRADFDALTS